MTITLIQPTAGYIGQGVRLFADTDQGVAGSTAEVFVTVGDFGAGLQATDAHAIVSVPSFSVILGWDSAGLTFQPPQNGLDLGHALSLQVIIYQPFPTVLDSHTFTGFFHDPISGFGGLLNLLSPAGVGGLTPTQATQLASAAGNSQGGTFKFPLIGVLQAIAYVPTITGGVTVDLGGGPVSLATWGMSWEAVVTPAYVGGQLGVITEASRRVVQFAVDHTLLSGAGFTDQIYESHALTGSFFFDSPDPSNVSVFVYPGYQVNVSWLLT